MSDIDIINAAYQETVKKVYAVFYDAYITRPNPTAEKHAEEQFIKGIQDSRAVRDRALAVLP